jgi:hypothetical protein
MKCYERLNLTGTVTYAAFSSVFPPVSRRPDELTQLGQPPGQRPA